MSVRLQLADSIFLPPLGSSHGGAEHRECPTPWTASIVESRVPVWAFRLPVPRHRARALRGLFHRLGRGQRRPAMWPPVDGWMGCELAAQTLTIFLPYLRSTTRS